MAKMNIPNRLTIIRILLVPVVVAVYLCMDPTIGVIDEASGLALRDVIAFVIFAVASITDFFDGMLARKNNWITSFGKFADPIADKMLVNTVLILMVYFHQANVIAVLLMIARDLIVDGLRMSAANSGEVVSAGIFGKLKTVLQMFALVFLLLKDWPFVYMGICMDQILLWAATVASLYSGFQPIEKIRFGDYVMTEAKQLVSLCTENHLTISSCESLTAGLFTSTIASIPGASAILKGGLVTYFTPMKSVLAHVDVNLIQNYGVISEECAYAMAKNTREIMDVDYCVSFTGNAGPSAWEEKPAGRVYCAKKAVRVYGFQCTGLSRNDVREHVVCQMIDILIQTIQKENICQKKK